MFCSYHGICFLHLCHPLLSTKAVLHWSSLELEAERLTILVSCICVGCSGSELPLQVC